MKKNTNKCLMMSKRLSQKKIQIQMQKIPGMSTVTVQEPDHPTRERAAGPGRAAARMRGETSRPTSEPAASVHSALSAEAGEAGEPSLSTKF